MGRGNVCVHNDLEGLYYLDNDFIHIYSKVNRCSCGNPIGFDEEEEPRTARSLSEAGIEYWNDFDGSKTGWKYDECLSRDSWEEMIAIMRERIQARFKSFSVVDRLRGATAYSNESNRYVVLENEFFEIAVVDNEWSAAWMLLEKVDIEESRRPFMARHNQRYIDAIRDILVEVWGEAIAYGGAWTSGKKFTKASSNVA